MPPPAAAPATVKAADRRALLRKYRLLAAWRRAKDDERSGGPPPDRGALRKLADEFPGALRELDLLGIVEIERRINILAGDGDRAASGEAWLAWIAAYHAVMRDALAVKRALGRRVDPAAAGELGAFDPTFVQKVARPPGGRLAVLVLRELAARFDVPAGRISAVLFPPAVPRRTRCEG